MVLGGGAVGAGAGSIGGTVPRIFAVLPVAVVFYVSTASDSSISSKTQ